MSEFYEVDIFQCRGSSFDIGYQIGEQLKNNKIVDVYKEKMKPTIDIANMESVFSTYAPHLIEELKGISEGLEISYKEAAAIFSGYDIPKMDAMGCSATITNDFYVRNYDFSPLLYDHIFSLVDSEVAYASAGYSQQVLGRLDGVNSEGLVMGLHFVSFKEFQNGISAWTAIRMVLDTCSSTSEAVDLLKVIPHAACYNFSIGDKSGDIAVVEASPNKVVMREDKSYLTCVNHFQNQDLHQKNRKYIEFSMKRNMHMQELNKKGFSEKQMFERFKDSHSPLFFKNYDDYFGTLHTFCYSFHDSKITTCLAKSEHVLSFYLDDWVNGKAISNTSMSGKIERESI
ncbi:peptidase C45 [Oceanobacillus sp. E9]|uniref:C45 family autoproteolytic acyltransferase/hydolase n=2 Tax=Bacillaceae TaxID=186817 RepID=UPI0003467305|nr:MULTISPECIES: C45 family peptidase [Oceanobacillus]OEH53840.1 peptidase C45 [Oceanobacillus sp. E9]